MELLIVVFAFTVAMAACLLWGEYLNRKLREEYKEAQRKQVLTLEEFEAVPEEVNYTELKKRAVDVSSNPVSEDE